jgi:hypothetical protein
VSLDKDFSTFGRAIVISSSESVILLGLLYPEDKRKFEPPKRQQLFIQRLRVTSQDTRTFSKKALGTPNVALRNQQSTTFRYYSFIHSHKEVRLFCDIIWCSVLNTVLKLEIREESAKENMWTLQKERTGNTNFSNIILLTRLSSSEK